MTSREDRAEAIRMFVQKNIPRQYLEHGNAAAEDIDHIFSGFNVGARVILRWEVSFTVSVSISFGLESPVEISWPSSGRTVTSATACLALYRQVVDFASSLECFRLEVLRWK